MKYNVKVSEEQLKIIAESVDLYSRLKCGQLKEIKNIVYDKKFDMKSVDYALQQLKILLFKDLIECEYYGIYQDKTPREAEIGYGISKFCKHQLHKDDESWSVYKDYPSEISKKYQCKVVRIDG